MSYSVTLRRATLALLLFNFALFEFGCSGQPASGGAVMGGAVRLQGAGATFPNPAEWRVSFPRLQWM